MNCMNGFQKVEDIQKLIFIINGMLLMIWMVELGGMHSIQNHFF